MKEVSYKDLKFNPFNLIGGEWMLITAGDEHSSLQAKRPKGRAVNTMTASWGHLGCLWGNNDPSAVVYIRESRYTKEFVDEEPYFSLCVMDKSFKKQMAYLGSTSGRDEDKIAKAGLTPVYADNTVYFRERSGARRRRSMQKSSKVASSIRKPSTRVIRRVTITPCTSVRSKRCW